MQAFRWSAGTIRRFGSVAIEQSEREIPGPPPVRRSAPQTPASVLRWTAAAGELRLAKVEPSGKPSAGPDPTLGCARSSNAALALSRALALTPTLALPNASHVSQPTCIGGPYQDPAPPSKPSAPG